MAEFRDGRADPPDRIQMRAWQPCDKQNGIQGELDAVWYFDWV
jgi:hypothetical protein